jgi:hypothetical protein
MKLKVSSTPSPQNNKQRHHIISYQPEPNQARPKAFSLMLHQIHDLRTPTKSTKPCEESSTTSTKSTTTVPRQQETKVVVTRQGNKPNKRGVSQKEQKAAQGSRYIQITQLQQDKKAQHAKVSVPNPKHATTIPPHLLSLHHQFPITNHKRSFLGFSSSFSSIIRPGLITGR